MKKLLAIALATLMVLACFAGCGAKIEEQIEEKIEEKTEGKNIVVELHVAQSDMGKVIGKQGRIAKAIRSVVKAASSKDNTIVDVEII